MASVITRSNHPDALWPGVREWFGLNYDEFPEVYSQIFDIVKGEYATERLIEATGFGLARTKTESAPIAYDSDGEGYATTATPTVIALGYQVTREEMEDNLYKEVSTARAGSLAYSMRTTIELAHANLFINGFSSSYVYGDGQPLFSASHPTKSGLQSNLPTVNADFSEASLEDMIKNIYLTKNSRGLAINLQPKKLIVSAADMFNVTRVIESQLRTGSANNGSNEVNAIKAMGLIPDGAIVNPYFGTDTGDAWFLQTQVQKDKGLVSIWRREVELEKDNDFDTENLKAKATARFVASVADWRSCFGTQGS